MIGFKHFLIEEKKEQLNITVINNQILKHLSKRFGALFYKEEYDIIYNQKNNNYYLSLDYYTNKGEAIFVNFLVDDFRKTYTTLSDAKLFSIYVYKDIDDENFDINKPNTLFKIDYNNVTFDSMSFVIFDFLHKNVNNTKKDYLYLYLNDRFYSVDQLNVLINTIIEKNKENEDKEDKEDKENEVKLNKEEQGIVNSFNDLKIDIIPYTQKTLLNNIHDNDKIKYLYLEIFDNRILNIKYINSVKIEKTINKISSELVKFSNSYDELKNSIDFLYKDVSVALFLIGDNSKPNLTIIKKILKEYDKNYDIVNHIEQETDLYHSLFVNRNNTLIMVNRPSFFENENNKTLLLNCFDKKRLEYPSKQKNYVISDKEWNDKFNEFYRQKVKNNSTLTIKDAESEFLFDYIPKTFSFKGKLIIISEIDNVNNIIKDEQLYNSVTIMYFKMNNEDLINSLYRMAKIGGLKHTLSHKAQLSIEEQTEFVLFIDTFLKQNKIKIILTIEQILRLLEFRIIMPDYWKKMVYFNFI